MPDLQLIFRLWIRVFSLKKKSLRRPCFKRGLLAVVILPLLITHILLSHFFLMLDNWFFPKFKARTTSDSVFIVGFPRSGTSFFLKTLSDNRSQFTAFQLWEMVLAPSILQKIFYLQLGKILRTLKLLTPRRMEQLNHFFFQPLKGKHDLKWQQVNEDEFLFGYLFQSVYLIYLFPELEDIHGLLEPDGPTNLSRRIRNMQFYESLVKRHLYVFDPKHQKRFLSKNPNYPARLLSLTTVFPEASYLVIHRPLEKILPSLISLNLQLYQFYSTPQPRNPLRYDTINIMLNWKTSFKRQTANLRWRKYDLDFKNLIQHPSKEIRKIHQWLNIPIKKAYHEYLLQQDKFSEDYKSQHHYEGLTTKEMQLFARKVL